MNFLHRLAIRVAQELAANPRARAKVSKVFKDDVKPRASKAWKEAQPEIENAKHGLGEFARKVREEYRKGREGKP